MAGVTKEQIKQAKEWDLLSYLQTYEPQELKRCGSREYCTRTHDSLKISNGKWCWNSRGIGGRTALDYLIKVRGLRFVNAVETLCGHLPPPAPERSEPEKTKIFTLPKANRFPSAVIGYLQDRCIEPEIIDLCIRTGILYESRKYQNCVFVGRDTSGRARAATLRGTHDKFKGDVEGSDKHFSFYIPAADKHCSDLAVTESPIDALSVATLIKRSGKPWRDSHYLSLGGTGPRALLQFLHDHSDITKISLCLDNDKAGLKGIRRLEAAISDDAMLAKQIKLIYPNLPPKEYGKDYNELLTTLVSAERSQRQERSAAR